MVRKDKLVGWFRRVYVAYQCITCFLKRTIQDQESFNFDEIGKGQMISKGLFGVLEFSQKTNEQIRRSNKNEFVRSFLGRIRGYQKSFRNYVTFNFGSILQKTYFSVV